MENKRKCVIWGTNASIGYDPRDNDKLIFDSPRAGGKYIVEHQRTLGVSNSWNWENKKKVRFSGYIAEKNLLDKTSLDEIPLLDSFLDDEKWLEKLPPTPDNLDERSDLLLKGLAKLYPDKGKTINLNINAHSNLKGNSAPFLCALSYCSDSEGFRFLLLDVLKKELKHIEIESDFSGGAIDIKITPAGWRKIEEVENKTQNTDSQTAFIAMWIDPSVDNVKDSIETAVRNAGYEPLRIDDKEHCNKIDNEILFEIGKAKFVVCDLTSSDKDKPRSSVYFEAGYAKGKKIPVIWTCKEQMKEVHFNSFDTRQYKCLFWNENNMEGFIEELQAHIENDKDIGKGSLKGGVKYEKNTT